MYVTETFSFRIRLLSIHIWRMLIFLNPLSRVENNKSATNPITCGRGNFWIRKEEVADCVPEKFPRRSRNGPQSRVVKKAINVNPVLKVNRCINFACIQMFFAAYVFYSFRLYNKLKDEGQTIKQKTSPNSYKIKILLNIRLTYRSCVTVKQFEKFSLNFSISLFSIRVNLLHP